MNATKILIAEDDPVFRHELGVFFRQHGFAAVCVEDGCQALEFAVRENPDLFLLDVHMPAGDGFSVAERLQRLPELALKPVFFMSHDSSRKVEFELKRHHATAFFRKPIVLHEMLGTIREVLSDSAKTANEEAA